MAKLVWNVVGERYFESGVSNGVLYVDGVGVAWPGLVSVSENTSGGEPRPYYIDGLKYLNLAASEEFEATIEAFSSPPEFAQCDGVGQIYVGLFATQQPRRPFDFSYRTRVGNDTEGLDHAYKIHLVYNALSAPADKTYTTIGSSIEAPTRSWNLTTLPPRSTGFRPTAHFAVDSRTTAPAALINLENLLYGTDNTTPAFPSLTELLAIFQAAA